MTQDKRRIWRGLWAVVLVLGTPIWLWAQQSAPAPKPGGTLKVAWEADITGLDPHTSSACRRSGWSATSLIVW